MDIQMPEMDGMTAARRIRALPGALGAVPIVALTANAMKGDRERYLEAGMDDYVSKPVTAAALQSALARSARPGRS
jgi:CheY-like chemotaxis protein